MATLDDSVEAFRAAYRRDEVGPRYTGWGHFTLTTATSLAAVAFAASRVHDVRPVEWLAVPVTFFIANAGEYLGHRGPMHHPRRGLRLLYGRHTLQHHRFFTNESMPCDSSRDFKMVLFPPVMLAFFLGVVAPPIGLVLFLVAGANVAWLYVATVMAYFITYEWLHLAYHARDDSLVARLPLLSTLRRHHTLHHDPRLMHKHNFNITFPICDRLFGTNHAGEEEEESAPPRAAAGGREGDPNARGVRPSAPREHE
jgi:sterol desaturase/sphingolipid hydroxylase (fatty acid hydroxylase superfamily)